MNLQVAPARVVVSTGTDHHPFDRLIGWVEDWLDQQAQPPDCVIQYAASTPPLRARGVALVSRQEMLDLYTAADVVILQGGPGSIFDARSVGHRPLAVPRLAKFNEVVDDHQVAFCRQLAKEGEIILIESGQELAEALTRALASPESVRTSPRPSGAAEASITLRGFLEQTTAKPTGFISARRVKQAIKQFRGPIGTIK